MRDESKLNPARKGCPGGRFSPVELSCQPCPSPGCSLCCLGCCLSPSGRRSPGMNFWDGQSCLLSRGSTAGWQHSQSGVGQGAPTATLLFSSPSNSFFVRTWNILLREGRCSSLFLGAFLQADVLAGLVTTENPRGFFL